MLQGTKTQPVAFQPRELSVEPPVNPSKSGFQNAPELSGIKGYINTPEGLSLSSLRGKVVLVDFWTYTCINCIRTLPYLKSWHDKYSDKGLVIVGVHTPEFEFEKEYSNVEAAVEKYGIEYPVVLDSDYGTWRAYNNHYWPHKFLIDADGYMRYDHIGEGGYEETEAKIVELLKERDEKIEMDESAPDVQPTDFGKIGTPELYLGYDFARAPLGNAEGFRPGETVSYSFPENFSLNTVYLDGDWKNNTDSIELASATGKVLLIYKAGRLNIVAGSDNGSIIRTTLEDGPLDAGSAGADSVRGADGLSYAANVNAEKLYNLISSKDYGLKTAVLDVNGKGFRLYTFTFG